MPLHLLGKKSWNVYNQKAVEQVQRDEAAAKRREEDEEQRLEAQDAAIRNAPLRGITPPTFPDQDVHLLEHGPQRMHRRDNGDRGRPEKRRKRAHGEDETDAEMRYAQEAVKDDRDQSHAQVVMGDRDRNAPLNDTAGHVQLFAQPDEREMRKRDAEESRKRRKQHDDEKFQTGMRFKDAAGFVNNQGGGGRPWYTSSTVPVPAQVEAFDTVPEKDVWGNEDLGRKERAQVRLSSSDPLAAMNAGAAAVRKHEAEKLAWRKAKEAELADLKQDQKRIGNREHDKSGAQRKEHHSKRDGKHRHHHRHLHHHRTEQRDRSRSRSPRRHSHRSHEGEERRYRSRSPRRAESRSRNESDGVHYRTRDDRDRRSMR